MIQITLIFTGDNAQAVCLWHIVINPCTRKMIPLRIAMQTDASYHVLACVAGGIVGMPKIKFWGRNRYFKVPLPILLLCVKYFKPDTERFIKQGN